MIKMGHISILWFLLLPLCTLIIGTSIKDNNHGMYGMIIGDGRCPMERQYVKTENGICHELCKNAQCPNGQHCCPDNCDHMCKPPPKVRPGMCPTFEDASSSEKCDSYCSTDSECREGWKCCKKGCGYTCTPTLSDIGKPSMESTARDGFCPQEEIYNCLKKERHFCNSESCMDGYKCCPKICRMQCDKPLQERAGECPAGAQCPPAADSKACSSDYDCPTFFKCCTNCGNRCARAVKIPFYLHNITSTLHIGGGN